MRITEPHNNILCVRNKRCQPGDGCTLDSDFGGRNRMNASDESNWIEVSVTEYKFERILRCAEIFIDIFPTIYEPPQSSTLEVYKVSDEIRQSSSSAGCSCNLNVEK